MKKLYRSRERRIIGGVAGGLADYFDIDGTIMRLAIAFMALVVPNVVLAYILAWIIIPEAPVSVTQPTATQPQAQVETTKPGPLATKDTADEERNLSADKSMPPTAGEILDTQSKSSLEEPEQADYLDGTEQPKQEVQAEKEEPGPQATQGLPVDTGLPESQAEKAQSDRNRQFFGYFLIIMGLLILVRKYVPSFWLNMPFRFLRKWWPVAIIALGLALILSVVRRDS